MMTKNISLACNRRHEFFLSLDEKFLPSVSSFSLKWKEIRFLRKNLAYTYKMNDDGRSNDQALVQKSA